MRECGREKQSMAPAFSTQSIILLPFVFFSFPFRGAIGWLGEARLAIYHIHFSASASAFDSHLRILQLSCFYWGKEYKKKFIFILHAGWMVMGRCCCDYGDVELGSVE
jgi:hypothetical protein